MAKAGKRHRLIVYTRMIDRWWPPIFLIGLSMLALAGWRYLDLYTRLTAPWQWMTLAGAGGLAVLASLLMILFRGGAYVRAFSDHFVVATPFLHMKVSYKRIVSTSSASMESMFSTRRMSFLKRDTIQPLLKRTALVVQLNALPMPRSALSLFLSPFFFKDQTPHIVLLVPDWMSLSTELDSMRMTVHAPAVTSPKVQSSLLSRLPHK